MGAYDRPVYAGDIARAVEICCRDDRQVIDAVGGKIIEAGGPDGKSLSAHVFPGVGSGVVEEADLQYSHIERSWSLS
jgi:hypothetical protein